MMNIKNDYDLIVHKLDEQLPYINIYPIGDLHVGSDQFNEKVWIKWLNMVITDPQSKVVMIGDMLDNGLKNSKTNSYESKMQPFEQKQWLTTQLLPIKSKIIGVCQGNHEYRSNILTGDCPLYDIMAKLDLEDLYRQNMAFIKVNLGRKNAERQWSYTLVLGHGASTSKVDKFGYSIDGADVFISGHVHSGSVKFPSKIVIDSKNEVVSNVGYVNLVVPSFQSYGGYALRGLYMPNDNNKFPVLKLSGTSKNIEVMWV